jgi:hypothetical protein
MSARPAKLLGMLRLSATLIFSLCLALGCSNSSSPEPSGASGSAQGGDGSTTGGTGAGRDCPATLGGSEEPVFDPPASRFRVSGDTTFMALDGVLSQAPHRELHTEAKRTGHCRLLTYESASFCDPGCENPRICVDGSCVNLLEPVSAGTLQLRLNDEAPIEIEPNDTGRYAWTTEARGVNDVERVAISAPGDVAAGFALQACLFEGPKPTQDWDHVMAERAPGEDVVLRWSNPIDVARVYVRMTTGIGTHGGISPVELECEGPDVGSLTLPGPYLDDLYKTGWSCGECGSNRLVRYHASQTNQGAATVQLLAESGASFWFIPGVAR